MANMEVLETPIVKPNYLPEYLTRKDVSELLQISLMTVDNWTLTGVLKAYRLGRRVYFKRSEIEASLIAITPKRGGVKQ